MISLGKSGSKLPKLAAFPLSTYQLNFSLDKIQPGVDNVRNDVYLSPAFCQLASKIIPQLIAKHIQLHEVFKLEKPAVWAKKVAEFKRLYRLVIEDAINKSKLVNNPQIDYLAQIAIIKFLIADVRSQFENTTRQIKNIIRKYESTRFQEMGDASKTKETLSSVLHQNDELLRKVGDELFQLITDVNQNELRTIREANFGSHMMLPKDILQNPIFYTQNPYHDSFLIEAYDVIFGRRIEDPDKYDTLIGLLEELFRKLHANSAETQPFGEPDEHPPDSEIGKPASNTFDPGSLIKHIGNIDILLNYFKTKKELKKHKGKTDPSSLNTQKQLLKNQKAVLAAFYKTFKKSKLIDRIAAAYEMRPIYKNYCPPLVPQQILLFMIDPRSRKAVIRRLKQLKKLYHQPFSLKPLNKKIKRLEFLQKKDKKVYLIRFLSGIARFHRDIENFTVFNDAMERVNLTADEEIITLSRANNTLYDFLLPTERVENEQPIINHVVIKADVRGSTDITYQMNKRGLNPASYFSLNFFNPISEVLNDYGAVKVFIEGDAIILSIFEREQTPGGWYGVARACGLAINMLLIIKRYNAKNKKNQLPILEIGIGINFQDAPPTFLFDGNQRIMISSAINLADRQSSCSKSIRSGLKQKKTMFNLYVYQTATDKEVAESSDDILLRYNVNGIELNPAGFKKLSEEINLTPLEPDPGDAQQNPIKLYTGKFPLTTGRFQRLIIREGIIPRIDPKTFRTLRKTSRNYYEICTHPKIYKYVRTLLSKKI
jgi:hypothetical protein